MTSRRCCGCGLVKVAEQFYRKPWGLSSHCRPCHRETARLSFRRRYPMRKAVIRARWKAWKAANLERLRVYRRQYKSRMRDAAREERAE